MKNVIILLMIISIGIFLHTGCGNTSSETTKNTNEKANIGATKTEESAKNVPKLGDVSPENNFKVKALIEKASADKDAWMGKIIAVTGYVRGISSSGGHIVITLANDQTDNSETTVACSYKGDEPKGIISQNVEVKGQIDQVNINGDKSKSVWLSPCELKK